MNRFCPNCGASVEKTEESCPTCGYSFLDSKLEVQKKEESIYLLFFKKFKFIIISVVVIMLVLAIGISVIRNENNMETQIEAYYQAIFDGNATYLVQNTVYKDGEKKISEEEIAPFIAYFKEKPNELKNLRANLKKKDTNFGKFIVNGTKFIVVPEYAFEIKTVTISAETNQKNTSFYIDGKDLGKSNENNKTLNLGIYLPGKYEIESIFEYNDKEYKNNFSFDTMNGKNYIFDASFDLFAANITANILEGDIFINNQKIAALKDGKATITPTVVVADGQTEISVKGSVNKEAFNLPIKDINVSEYAINSDEKNYKTLNIELPIISLDVKSNIEGGDLVLNGNKIGQISEGKAKVNQLLLTTDSQIIEVKKEFSSSSISEQASVTKSDDQSTIEINSNDLFGNEQIQEFLTQLGQSMPLRIDNSLLSEDKASEIQEKLTGEIDNAYTELKKKTSLDVTITNCEFSIQEITQTDINNYTVKATYKINSTTPWTEKGLFGLVNKTKSSNNTPIDGKYTTWTLKNEDGVLKLYDFS